MNLRDALILFAVGFLFAYAVRKIQSKKKKGCYNCSDCSTPCNLKDKRKK